MFLAVSLLAVLLSRWRGAARPAFLHELAWEIAFAPIACVLLTLHALFDRADCYTRLPPLWLHRVAVRAAGRF